MNKIIIMAALLLVTSIQSFSQKDTTSKNEPDTIVVGKFVIIKKNKDYNDAENKDSIGRSVTVNIGSGRKNYRSNISTNWFIFDLGFANYRDNTDYTSANEMSYLRDGNFTSEDFKLRNGKSSNVNIWLFMQRLNVIKHVINLKYGLGLEMYNFRYESNMTYHNNPAYIYHDTINFLKNKLYVGYVTIPFMVNFNATPRRNNGLSLSAGVSAGYLLGAHNKQISTERGKQKIYGDFDLTRWQLAAIGEIGLGPVRFYGSYSFTPLHQTSLVQYPYTAGIRFSNW